MESTPDPTAGWERNPVHADAPLPHPAGLVRSWLPGAGADAMLMTVSTVDAEGCPRARTVRLTGYDGERFLFHTDARSSKVAELAAEPRVALTLLWAEDARQLVVQGTARATTGSQRERAYEALPPYLKQLAWLNSPEYATLSLAQRERRWADFAREHPDPPQPQTWTGFAVTPHRLLFWASTGRAASRRLEYTRGSDGWDVRHLPG
ncbi:pyridoxamine 5'-phosphate oxidase family protein [Microbacterium paludicola]|uniref:pyridoxamine 5'-phosphate oxidase family protein n=1 Tax=Microbacterium paludicola TaxID=300019 RepID=UPI0031CF01F0